MAMHSTPGKGTTFEVLLPETAELEDAIPTALGVLPSAVGTEAILVIERDDGLRKMIAGILALDGYTATDAPTVAAANLPGLEPQLVIIDNGSGPAAAFLQKLSKPRRELRVICTAAQRPALAGFSERHIAHLPKPFALSALLTKVRALLDTRAE
jgi:DNA-binding response OmpR family regulator